MVKKSTPVRRILLHVAIVTSLGIILGGVFIVAALAHYSNSMVSEITQLMEATPSNVPSLIFSDGFWVLPKQHIQDNHLSERLTLANHSVTNPNKDTQNIEIRYRKSTYVFPNTILAPPSTARMPDKIIEVVEDNAPSSFCYGSDAETFAMVLEGGVIQSIRKTSPTTQDCAGLYLEPILLAQIAGSTKEVRDYIRLESIPTPLLQAIISIEDQRFLEHIGFDLKSLARALYVNLKAGALSQGGSTLTQQLVKNLTGSKQKTLLRKVRELGLALLIEVKFSKEAILEKYLNEVYFGQIGSLEVHGVAEAAKYFFAKKIDELTLAEIALIAGVVRGPTYYSPYKYLDRALKRKNTVLSKMLELNLITQVEFEDASHQTLVFAPPSTTNNKAPFFVDFAKAEALEKLPDALQNLQGLNIYTTADPILQSIAERTVRDSVKQTQTKLKYAQRLEGVVLSAESKTGALKAVVGGQNYAESTFNRALNMRRQVGSIFKPLVYLAAFDLEKDQNGEPYAPARIINDSPWQLKIPGQKTWIPKNYEKTFRGAISFREALSHSVNIPAARLGQEIGIDRVINIAKKLGITETLPAVPSLALGAVEIAPQSMLQAYTTIANFGIKNNIYSIKYIEDNQHNKIFEHSNNTESTTDPVIAKNKIWLLHSLLNSVTEDGTARGLKAVGMTRRAFVKTGTTNDSRDAWFAGFAEDLTTVSWVGPDDFSTASTNSSKPRHALITGAGAAMPIWATLYKQYYAGPTPSYNKLEPIEGVAIEQVDQKSGFTAIPRKCPPEQTREEYFLTSAPPTKSCPLH